MGESSGRELVKNVGDPTIHTSGPTHHFPPSSLSQHEVMDVEAMFESAQHVMDTVDSRERAGSSSCKRLRLEGGFLVIQLSRHRLGKQPIFPKGESLAPPITHDNIPNI